MNNKGKVIRNMSLVTLLPCLGFSEQALANNYTYTYVGQAYRSPGSDCLANATNIKITLVLPYELNPSNSGNVQPIRWSISDGVYTRTGNSATPNTSFNIVVALNGVNDPYIPGWNISVTKYNIKNAIIYQYNTQWSQNEGGDSEKVLCPDRTYDNVGNTVSGIWQGKLGR